MNTITIDKSQIGVGHPCFIVSELGAMYEDISGMKELIRLSKEAGADAVKIQTYQAETLALPDAEFEFEDGSRQSQYEFFKTYEISRDDHKILFNYAKEQGIVLFSAPSSYEDVDFLDDLGVPVFKTGSDDLTNYPFLEYVASKGKPVIVSTGMATIGEVEDAVNTVLKTGNDQLILLHCTVSYPVKPEYANLNIIKTLKQAFNVPVGYSDHVFGTFSSVLAASMGACMVEKHFTRDRGFKHQDYQVSLEPDELKVMVEEIKQIPILQGSSVKKIYPCEEKWRRNARKSIVTAHNLSAGNMLKSDDIKIVRAGMGMHPHHLDLIIGKQLKKDLNENQLICLGDFS